MYVASCLELSFKHPTNPGGPKFKHCHFFAPVVNHQPCKLAVDPINTWSWVKDWAFVQVEL